MTGADDDILDVVNEAEHTPAKRLRDWLLVAQGLHWLHSQYLMQETEIEDDDDPNFMRDPKYRAALDKYQQRFPKLISYIRNAAIRRDLFWMHLNGSDLEHWAVSRQDIEEAMADTTPQKIRVRYIRFTGGDWKATQEELAHVRERKATEEARDKEILGDVEERIEIAEDVVSHTPRSR